MAWIYCSCWSLEAMELVVGWLVMTSTIMIPWSLIEVDLHCLSMFYACLTCKIHCTFHWRYKCLLWCPILEVWALCAATVQWKKLPVSNEPPPPRAYHTMTRIGPRFLLIGGYDGKSTFGDLWWLVSEGLFSLALILSFQAFFLFEPIMWTKVVLELCS